MSKLSQLTGNGKKIKLGEVEIEIKPLTVSAMPTLMQMGDDTDKEKQASAMQQIVSLTLKAAVPDVTDEEIANLPLEHATTLMTAIMEVNKMEQSDEHKKAFMENVKRTQTAGN